MGNAPTSSERRGNDCIDSRRARSQCHTADTNRRDNDDDALWPRTPVDERLTLVNAPGANAYPLTKYEYAVVSKKQPSPETAAALRSFCYGRSRPTKRMLKSSRTPIFIPLPAQVWAPSHDQIEEIS